ncbi:MAG: hypothetical protein A2176_02540 [Spirochaetes bacterium RBG_13_51_14]|nr:MAG: hypothetical protein A2176_02540 [Spirochaetes bacterium RBG_13_51_14]
MAGCSVPESLKFRRNEGSAIIGVTIRVRLLNVFPKKQTTVYFVKLEEKDNEYFGTKIIRCNYTREFLTGIYAYIINAEPGKYAVVCSTKFDKMADTTIETKNISEVGYITFFDENAIKQSIVDVIPGQVVYMGSFVINSQLKSLSRNIENNGDSAQKHYYNLLKSYMDGTFYCGALIKADRSEKETREFLSKTGGYFKNTEWKDNIDKAVAELDNPQQEKNNVEN